MTKWNIREKLGNVKIVFFPFIYVVSVIMALFCAFDDIVRERKEDNNDGDKLDIEEFKEAVKRDLERED